jgi:transcriptional regulator with XRE-family HTH domain
MKLLDYLIKNHGYKNDNAIAVGTGISKGTISKIRTGKIKASAEIMIIIHEISGLPISQIKEMNNETDTDSN